MVFTNPLNDISRSPSPTYSLINYEDGRQSRQGQYLGIQPPTAQEMDVTVGNPSQSPKLPNSNHIQSQICWDPCSDEKGYPYCCIAHWASYNSLPPPTFDNIHMLPPFPPVPDPDVTDLGNQLKSVTWNPVPSLINDSNSSTTPPSTPSMNSIPLPNVETDNADDEASGDHIPLAHIKCWNCKKQGHRKAMCQEPPQKRKGSIRVITTPYRRLKRTKQPQMSPIARCNVKMETCKELIHLLGDYRCKMRKGVPELYSACMEMVETIQETLEAHWDLERANARNARTWM
jgi:hypothetical protein